MKSRIKEKWDEADACESKADSLKWEVARLLALSGRTHRDLAEETGRVHQTIGKWIAVHRQFGPAGRAKPSFNQALEQTQGRTPESERERKDASAAKKVLGDSAQRRRALASLAPEEVEAVIEDANEVAMDRVRAKRSEHDTRPTTRDLMGDDPFKPDEFWADSVILRLNRNAGELNSLIERGGGLLLGAMEPDRALDLLEEAERKIAEARAAAQEQVQDRMGVS